MQRTTTNIDSKIKFPAIFTYVFICSKDVRKYIELLALQKTLSSFVAQT